MGDQLHTATIESIDYLTQGKLNKLTQFLESAANIFDSQPAHSQDAILDGQVILENHAPTIKSGHPRVQAVYTSESPIYYMALMGAGIFVLATPITQFFIFGFFNGWSAANFTWWLIEFTIAIYILLIVLPDERLQKIFLWVSHYLQGITVALLFLNGGLFMETIVLWMQNIDLSNVFKNDYELIAREFVNYELFQTMPNIGYLFLVYFFIVDIRQFYINQDGTVAELIVSFYSLKAVDFLTYWINWINNFFITLYTYVWKGLQISFLPIVWFNLGIQWAGQLTLSIAKWGLGIFEVVFLWLYQILLIVFNFFVPLFQLFASWVPAPKWPNYSP